MYLIDYGKDGERVYFGILTTKGLNPKSFLGFEYDGKLFIDILWFRIS